jgi:hypothetical protein
MIRPRGRKATWTLGLTVALLLGVAIWVLVGRSTATGDPGGKVMDQLTPTVSALPGFGTAALPWVSQIPGSLGESYAIKMEPFRDSCDGIAGTQGWSQVVVQAGFRWKKGLSALVSFMNPRLKELGWSVASRPSSSNPLSMSWTKTLKNGSPAPLNVTQEGGPTSPTWQLDVIANPVGRHATGC